MRARTVSSVRSTLPPGASLEALALLEEAAADLGVDLRSTRSGVSAAGPPALAPQASDTARRVSGGSGFAAGHKDGLAAAAEHTLAGSLPGGASHTEASDVASTLPVGASEAAEMSAHELQQALAAELGSLADLEDFA